MKYFITLIICLETLFSFAQQEQQYTLYMANPYTLNPALAGTEEFIDFNIGGRYQWAGLSGSPITVYAAAHGVIGKPQLGTRSYQQKHHWHGVGAYVYQDQTGPLKRSSLLLSYAYNLQLSHDLRLSVGAFGGLKSVTVNDSYWENIDDQSDLLFSSRLSSTHPDLALGAWLYSDLFYVGFSAFQLLDNTLNFADDEQVAKEGSLEQHYFLTSGVNLQMTEEWFFVPSFMLKMAGNAPLSIDLNAKLECFHKYWVGASYRHLDAFIVMGGLYVSPRFEVNYGFDLTLSKLRKYNSGSHELVLSYHISKAKITCPSKFW